jgi:hypothetical protein
VTAALLLTLAFMGNDIGAVFALTIAVGVLYRDSWRRTLAIVSVPFGLFIVWWLLKAGHDSGLHIKEWPAWVATMVQGSAAGLVGDPPGDGVSAWGAPIAVLAIAAAAFEVGRRRDFPLSLAVGLAMPAAFIVLVTLGRGGRYDPIASRYTYTLFVLGLLALSEVFRGRRLETPGALIFVAPLVAFCVAGNLVVMSDGAYGIRIGAQLDKEYATATLNVGPAVADKVSSNQGDFLFVPGDTPVLYRWISQPAHRRYAYTPAELAADPGAQAAVTKMEKQLRDEAAKAQP